MGRDSRFSSYGAVSLGCLFDDGVWLTGDDVRPCQLGGLRRESARAAAPDSKTCSVLPAMSRSHCNPKSEPWRSAYTWAKDPDG